jgi:hypothetical protein
MRIGDIIRLQKCMCKLYRGEKQFNVNVYENKSEWAIYKGNVSQDSNENENDDMFIRPYDLSDLSKEKDFWLRSANSENVNPNVIKERQILLS